jgi:hypothetical protein
MKVDENTQLCFWIFPAAAFSAALPWHAYSRGHWRDVLSLLSQLAIAARWS